MSFAPRCVLVMRHAEKSADPNDPNLTDTGQDRAEKLATYIPDTFFIPDYIFASSISRHSARPYQTVEPLSKKTGKPIDATFADQDYGALAYTLLNAPQYAGRQIVVCWHHGNIPSLMRMLECPAAEYPDPWDPQVFNLILVAKPSNGAVSVTENTEPF